MYVPIPTLSNVVLPVLKKIQSDPPYAFNIKNLLQFKYIIS